MTTWHECDFYRFPIKSHFPPSYPKKEFCATDIPKKKHVCLEILATLDPPCRVHS